MSGAIGATAGSDVASPPLRRATYVHVSDLISAYNIDHELLERELKRVQSESSQVHRLLSKTDATSTPAAGTSIAIATHSIPSLIASAERDGTASDSSPQLSPKTLQPPRLGFNLCV
jgi:hypothetical protein